MIDSALYSLEQSVVVAIFLLWSVHVNFHAAFDFADHRFRPSHDDVLHFKKFIIVDNHPLCHYDLGHGLVLKIVKLLFIGLGVGMF